MQKHRILVVGCTCGAVLLGGLLALAKNKPVQGEQERQVKEAEVPVAALTALKKLAGSATITEFAEEIEHGHKFYEGSWKGPDGNVDGLVTETGDVVEIEEMIPAGRVPAAVRAALEKEVGKDATIKFEMKTVFVYEAHFKKDQKERETVLTPDGRRYRRGDGKERREGRGHEKDD